jgi:hypothetical protein
MKIRLNLTGATFLALSLAVSCSTPSPPKKIVTSVRGFGPINADTIGKYETVAVLSFNQAPGSPESGSTVSALLTEALSGLGFIVVERSRLEHVFQEQRLQLTHADENANLLRIGKMTGAKAVVVGEVLKWDEAQSQVTVSFRLVDAGTGIVLFTGFGEVPEPGSAPVTKVAGRLLTQIMNKFSERVGWGTGKMGVAYDLVKQDGVPVIVVTRVQARSVADYAGFKVGDVIRSCNGTPSLFWKTEWEFLRLCRHNVGEPIVFEVIRENRIYPLTAIPLAY